MLSTINGSRPRALYSASRGARVTCPAAISQVHRHTYSTLTPAPTRAAKVIFSGIQPTGVPHLGNYLGALRQWVQLQDTAAPDTKLLFSIVDLHALTIRQDREQLVRWKREALATLMAVGLDPKRCTIFFQSDVCSTCCQFACQIKKTLRRRTNGGEGSCTCRADVDIELYSFNGISFSNDTMEGMLLFESFVSILKGLYIDRCRVN